METLTCDLCGQETHTDTSDVFDTFTVNGMKTERHCFECNPPDEEW